jgi:hypothetical protein
MRSEFTGADDSVQAPPPRPVGVAAQGTRASKAKPRITRSRIAKPLLTSLGTVTMLATSSLVLLAVSATGSARPWDWTRADPSAAVSRYQVCGQQGLGAIGCMLSASFRPASAAPATGTAGGAHQPRQPLFSVATVQDAAPAQAGGASQRTAPPSAPVATAGSRSHAAGSSAAGTQHLVEVPANATTDDVFAACQAAMKTAQSQGAAAMKEVEVECGADLATRCPAAVKTPQAQGAAAIQELETECRAPMPQGGNPGRDD